MAVSIAIETEQGTCAGFVHQHNGYYAGDFSQVPINAVGVPACLSAPGNFGS